MSYTREQLNNIPHILSEPRFATYLQHCGNDRTCALRLYQWNLEISSAFLLPLHLLEISLRNAVAESIENVYTQNWPWDQRFILSLPDRGRFSPRSNLQQVARMQNPTVGKVVAELKFVFWEKMFTARHDVRIWNHHIKTAFPNSPQNMSVREIREKAFDDIFCIRGLRNRIAHHEPIFSRNLQEDYKEIHELIEWRDQTTSDWMDNIQNVTNLIGQKPDTN